MNFSGVKVFNAIAVGEQEASLFNQFLAAHDFAPGSRRGFTLDLRKFARWFSAANKEPFHVARPTRSHSTWRGSRRGT
jgi:hypothetical protein